jgi:hypothetical protein
MSIRKPNRMSLHFSAMAMIALLLIAWGMWIFVIIPRTSMHPDESWTFDYMVAQSPIELVQILTHDTHPPMWWIIFWTWHHATGGSEFAGRWIGAFFGLLTLASVYRLARIWFKDTRYGLFAVILLMFSAPFVWLSIEIRPYSLLFFLTCYSMFTFRRWMQRQTWRTAALYAAACAMLMYIHYYLAFLMVAQALYLLLTRPSRRLLGQGLGVAGLAFLIWSPWSMIFLRQVTLLKNITPSEQGGIGFVPTTSPTNWTTIIELFTTLANGFPWLMPLLIIVGIMLLWRKSAYRLVLTWGLVPLTLLLLINLRVEVFTLRYISYALVGIVVASGFALAALPRRVGWGLTAIVAILLAVNLTQYLPTHPPYRDVLQQVAAEVQPNDVIYLDFINNEELHLHRQLQLYLPSAMHSQLVTEMPTQPATTSRRIWHLTNALLAPEQTQHLKQLDDGSRVIKFSAGECSPRYCLVAQLFEGPPLASPKTFGDSISFYGSEIQSLSAQQLDVILWWRFDTPPTFDYSIGLYLLDADGKVIGQADGAIHNYYGGQEVLMTSAEPDRYYLDVRHIILPADVSRAIPYTLALAVYDWRNGERLPVDKADLLPINTITLPVEQ